MPETYITQTERETEDFAYNLAKENKINFGDIVALRGDLGAGKTAFTRGFVRFFSPDLRVTSPTFSLVNEYKINDITRNDTGVVPYKKILHFDMYRINSRDDLLSVGFYDYLDDLGEKIIIIEWFDKIAGFFDENTITVDIAKLNENERRIYVDSGY